MSGEEELIARLEKLSGPDREVDCLIGVAVGAFRAEPPRYEGDDVRYAKLMPDGSWMSPGQAGDMLVPRYTASIDAALMAGEPSWEYSISTLYGIARVEIPLNDTRVAPVSVNREHGYVPVALLEAILKARSSKDGERE